MLCSWKNLIVFVNVKQQGVQEQTARLDIITNLGVKKIR